MLPYDGKDQGQLWPIRLIILLQVCSDEKKKTKCVMCSVVWIFENPLVYCSTNSKVKHTHLGRDRATHESGGEQVFKQSNCAFINPPPPYPRWNDRIHIHTHTPVSTDKDMALGGKIQENLARYMLILLTHNKNSILKKQEIGKCLSAHPELDQVECVMWALSKQLLEAALLLWELVIDLPNVHTLQQWVAIAWTTLADVHKQVLVVLRGEKKLNQMRI